MSLINCHLQLSSLNFHRTTPNAEVQSGSQSRKPDLLDKHEVTSPITTKMHRLALRIAPRGSYLPSFPRTTRTALPSLHTRRTYASSSPKEAEGPSAQSGGSRSKDAAQDTTTDNSNIDGLADSSAKGRTGGGEPLSSSSNPPPKPKITNASVPGEGRDKLTKEQQEEVDRHNADFDKKHDRASAAGEDKVDKGFWSGRS